jgi:CheY-like chemotaxis protein
VPARILVVDDERSIADSVAEIVGGAGYEARTAYTGPEAVTAAGSFGPNLLLTDVLMPGMNGFELALQVKQAYPSCRLVLFSGEAATAALAQRFAREFTSRGYNFTLLPKPIHPARLLEKLQESLAQAG